MQVAYLSGVSVSIDKKLFCFLRQNKTDFTYPQRSFYFESASGRVGGKSFFPKWS